jgi:NAD(P)-dependent dehydrogenase (short-subunit alcohol dehydrogenase family)
VKAKAYKSNAGDFAQCEAFVTDVLKEFGTVDICVNNAGISKDNLLLRMSQEQWDDVIKVNLNSVFYMTKQVIKPMMKARSGSIINMSSIIGETGNAGQSSYAASKAGIIGFTKSVAKRIGKSQYPVPMPLPRFCRNGHDELFKRRRRCGKNIKLQFPWEDSPPVRTSQTFHYSSHQTWVHI